MAEKDELLVPKSAKEDPASFELLRVWKAHESQHVSLRTGVWDDPAAWGVMLVDLARHIANSYHQSESTDRLNALQRIKAGWDAEIMSSTDEPTGKILD